MYNPTMWEEKQIEIAIPRAPLINIVDGQHRTSKSRIVWSRMQLHCGSIDLELLSAVFVVINKM